jgi:hypothetical protein
MPDDADRQALALWIEKATWRLSECEAEAQKLGGDEERGRRRKLRTRANRYRSLLDHLREQVAGGDTDRLRQLEEDEYGRLERELSAVKERVVSTASILIQARSRLRELKTRWGKLADEIMKERELRGQPRGRVDRLDFGFTPPAPGSSREERALHDLLRELGL